MDLLIDAQYRCYRLGLYTLSETLLFFRSHGVTVEDCRDAGYDETFISLLTPARVSSKAKRPQTPSFFVRPAILEDVEHLEHLAEKFLLELNGTTDKDDLTGVSSLLLFEEDKPEPLGALWHEVLENNPGELYIRALYTEPSIRLFGGGRALVRYVLEETAPNGGFRTVGLDAPENVARFYRRLGFRAKRDHNTDGMSTFHKKVEY